MKIIYTLFISSFICIFENLNAQTWQWAGKAGGLENDFANAIDVDEFGNSYVTGTFYNSASFGSIILVNPGVWSVYIAKYDVAGNLVWAKIVASDSAISVSGIHVDVLENISITGQYFASATFGNAPGVNLTSSANYDVYVARYNTTGDLIWARSLGGQGIDYAGGICTDNNNNVLITGDFHITSFPNSGSKIFIAKFDSAGSSLWLKMSLNNGTDHFGNGIKTDSIGNIFITGDFFNTLIFDSSAIIDAGNIESNTFVAKFDSSGNIIWGQKAGAATGYCGSKAIDIDNTGNSYITGYFHGTISLGALSISGTTGLSNEIFVAKCDTGGNFIWVNKSIGTGSSRSVSVTNTGNVFIGGVFTQNISFGLNSLTTAGGNDIFIAGLNQSGNFTWTTSCGGRQQDNVGNINANANGIYLVGNFIDTIHFGTSLLLSAIDSTKSDIFVAKLDLPAGIDDVNPLNNVTVFPNPAVDQFTITFGKFSQKNKVTITDINGRVIYSGIFVDKEKIIVNTKYFSEGIYFVRIQTEDFAESKKLIIVK